VITSQPRVLYVTDLAYEARGRRYCDEDIYVTSRLRDHFHLALCPPQAALGLMDLFDAVVVRNSGPVLGYQAAYDAFRERALASGTRVYNQLTGRADMVGKNYLVELTSAGYPVIPTIDRVEHLDRLPRAGGYVVKPKRGADSVGLQFLPLDKVAAALDHDGETLAQPRIDFDYEVSFYFVDDEFQYALHAPRRDRRWEMTVYEPSDEDLAFARRFIAWNTIDHGIQRVDACRAPNGELLLVEVEDLNPYLSLDLLDDAQRDRFVQSLRRALTRLLAA
jgi:hypothetical protein